MIIVEPSARLFEYMPNHLRLKEPLFYRDYQARTGGEIEPIKKALAICRPIIFTNSQLVLRSPCKDSVL